MVYRSFFLVLLLGCIAYADTGQTGTVKLLDSSVPRSCVAGQINVSPGTLTCAGQVATLTTGGGSISSSTLPGGSTQYIQNTLTPTTTTQAFTVQTASATIAYANQLVSGGTTPLGLITAYGNIFSRNGSSSSDNIMIGDVAYGGGFPGIWFSANAAAPTYNNFSFLYDPGLGTIFNTAVNFLNFRIANNNYGIWNTIGLSINNDFHVVPGGHTGLYVASGKVGIGLGLNGPEPNAQLEVDDESASRIGTIFKSTTSQTSDITEWQDINSNILAKVDSAGNVVSTNTITAQYGVVASTIALTATNPSITWPSDTNSAFSNTLNLYPSGTNKLGEVVIHPSGTGNTSALYLFQNSVPDTDNNYEFAFGSGFAGARANTWGFGSIRFAEPTHVSQDIGFYTSNASGRYEALTLNASAACVGVNKTNCIAQLDIQAANSTMTGTIIRGAANQTANLLELRDSNNNLMTMIASDGSMSIGTPLVRSAELNVSGATTNKYEVTMGTASTDNHHVMVSTNGHVMTNGLAPSISSCGGGSPSVSGTDVAGTITVGSGVTTACTLTFATPYSAAPVCIVSDNSTAVTGDISSISATAVTFGFSASLGGGQVYYTCIGTATGGT